MHFHAPPLQLVQIESQLETFANALQAL
jgi:hypothetical protein